MLNLVELQDFLGIGVLRNHLTYYMLTSLNSSNCWLYHEVAERHYYLEVLGKADRFIRSNFEKLTLSKKSEFLKVSPHQLFSLLRTDFLSISSQEILLMVRKILVALKYFIL